MLIAHYEVALERLDQVENFQILLCQLAEAAWQVQEEPTEASVVKRQDVTTIAVQQ